MRHNGQCGRHSLPLPTPELRPFKGRPERSVNEGHHLRGADSNDCFPVHRRACYHYTTPLPHLGPSCRAVVHAPRKALYGQQVSRVGRDGIEPPVPERLVYSEVGTIAHPTQERAAVAAARMDAYAQRLRFGTAAIALNPPSLDTDIRGSWAHLLRQIERAGTARIERATGGFGDRCST